MTSMLNLLSQAGDLLLVVFGFSLIIVIHELGHFVAARWAGIRVLAFAVGFGPALLSYRKGMGFRRGSSEADYKKLEDAAKSGTGSSPAGVSTTEYRLNGLPFGGYVKMLGQDDSNPAARSEAPDSYQNCKPWKRMIVISAGVAANIVTAAMLFIVVFMLGLKTEPATIGMVEPGSPAATTIATNADKHGVVVPGLQPGDEIVAIDGEATLSFQDMLLASMLASPDTAINLDVKRRGTDGLLNFLIKPKVDPTTRALMIGAGPASSNTLGEAKTPEMRANFERLLQARGLIDLEPGMTLISIGGKPAVTPYELNDAANQAAGRPITATFRSKTGKEVTVDIATEPSLQSDQFLLNERESIPARHLLGLLPVLAVEEVARDSEGERIGLKSGDVFVQLGEIEWPSVPAGVAEIRAHAGNTIKVVVSRRNEAAAWADVSLGDVRVNSKGQIGFAPGDSSGLGAWIGGNSTGARSASANLPRIAPGSMIVGVNDEPTGTLAEVSLSLARAAAKAGSNVPAAVTIKIELPIRTRSGDRPPTETVAWKLSEADVGALAVASWQPALEPAMFFQTEQFMLKAANPGEAIAMGLHETRRVMLTTYITFARLFQGTVKVGHLRGPVGIAHVGTILAERGFVWLLFFMALISVNLAVVNFLPIPIADGGHFVFLLYEQITGKPVSVAVQNVAAIAGLVLLATMFLIVTFNDIARLFGV